MTSDDGIDNEAERLSNTGPWWRLDRQTGAVTRISAIEGLGDPLCSSWRDAVEHGRVASDEVCVIADSEREASEKARLLLAGAPHGSLEEQAAKRLLALYHGEVDATSETERIAMRGGGRYHRSELGHLAARMAIKNPRSVPSPQEPSYPDDLLEQQQADDMEAERLEAVVRELDYGDLDADHLEQYGEDGHELGVR